MLSPTYKTYLGSLTKIWPNSELYLNLGTLKQTVRLKEDKRRLCLFSKFSYLQHPA